MTTTGLDIMAAGQDRDSGYGIFMADRGASGPTALKRAGGRSDLNGDAKSDIVWRKTGPALDSVAGFLWLMNGTTVIGATYLDPIGVDWQIQAVADFTGDGKTDILWRNTDPAAFDAGKLYLWVMNGPTVVAGTGYTNAQADLTWQIQGVGDLNGDGRADIVWRKTGPAADTGAGFLWLMNGTTVIGATYLDPIGIEWNVQAVADLSGDGKADILWRNTNTSASDAGYLYLWVMNGPVVVAGTGYTNSQADLTWQVQGVGDLDGNGKADIVWRKTGAGADTGAGFLWLMNGASVVGATYLSPIGTDWQVEGIADLTGDNKADILWRNRNPAIQDAGKLYLWVMNGGTVVGGTGYTNAQADLSWDVKAPR
jgi:GH43 family beta-xylosidase